ncbi:transposase IS116/IS110/IS902 family protein [Hymenobacter roseosalivarius DSM 11622]|uniref:Transposase IS116/IS110/IS902 family protein n=1 Tax=Hymenobacter roseosalivarius DSM 11622 TaxID=645990 RepID=A0A1W1UJT5_9BACT|nr:IS110 family transposase [Hymenobacter roseosalivarius]SMB81378.1 transposase IS116/IS110/IS902 family protein [Hymenobacter roseosalivarius DSM 11622]
MDSSSPLPIVGIDVRKVTLAVCYHVNDQVKHLEVRNSKAGFQQLVKVCGAHCRFVMEATGTYNLALAYYLHEQGGQVAVLNPLVIKRFIQMHLSKGKSDRKDAQWLLRYGQQQAVKPWKPDESVLVECRQLEQVTEQLLKQKTMVSNALEALQRQPIVSKLALKRLQQTLKALTQQVEVVEAELLALLEQRFASEMTLLCSIPGIGRKTAGMLLLFTGGFTRLDNYRQLIAMAGLSPREHTSGTSIRGKVRITKMGGGLIRGKLFMCSFSAKKMNAACQALFDRLVARGKNKKLALIAVCNKLLKQAFAIVKSGVPYQADFSSKLTLTP